MEAFGYQVCDKSVHVGAQQRRSLIRHGSLTLTATQTSPVDPSPETQSYFIKPPKEPPPAAPPPSTSRPHTVNLQDPDYSLFRRFFAWAQPDTIRKTFQHTTQLGRLTVGTLLKRAYKAVNPALNVIRRGEPVATDTIYSDTPALGQWRYPCTIICWP